MRLDPSGYSLLELVVALALAVLLGSLLTPPILNWTGRLRVRMAAAEVEGALHLARMYAIRHRRNVAVKFRTSGSGEVTFTLYSDGDGDGVRNADIDSGTDPEERGPQRLGHFGDRVSFGFPPGRAPRDPSRPSRRLDRLHDPIRFNRSDLASFTVLGTATPGTVYVSDRRRHLAMVRVTGHSARIRVRRYDPVRERWGR